MRAEALAGSGCGRATRYRDPTPFCASRGPTAWSRTTGTSTARTAVRRPPPCRACWGRSASTPPPRSARSTWPSPTSRTCPGVGCCRQCWWSGRVGRRTCRCTSPTRTPSRCGSRLDPEESAAVGARSLRPTCPSRPGWSTGGWSGGPRLRTLPTDLPLGWHEVVAEGPSASAHSPLVVTPSTLDLPDALRERRAWGLMAQLYSVRSRRASWGMGDLADLAEIGWLAGRGLTAPTSLLVNPLHAATDRPHGAVAVPADDAPLRQPALHPGRGRPRDGLPVAGGPHARRVARPEPVLATDDDAGPIDRDAVWTAKRAALEVVFAAPRSAARQAAFNAFVAREGSGLETFAIWCALARARGQRAVARRRARSVVPGGGGAPRAAARARRVLPVAAVGARRAAGRGPAAARDGRDGRSGIMHDLAVGVHPDGADAWALADVLAPGGRRSARRRTVQPGGPELVAAAVATRALARCGVRPWRDMLRTVLRHAGGLRIDHVIGLFRLWLMPERRRLPRTGTYVRYDHEALVGILVLEAHRAGVVVVGRGPRHRRAVGAGLPRRSAGSSARRCCGSSATSTARR